MSATKSESDVVRHEALYIGGSWRPPGSDEVLEVYSPISEELIGVVPRANAGDIDLAVAAARKAFDDGPWPRLDVGERATALRRLARLFEARRDDLVRTVTAEAGLPIATWSAAAIDAGIESFNHFADLGLTYEWEAVRQGLQVPFIIRKEPVGVVGAILPWNSPVVLTIIKLAPALLAGCPVVYKPAPETPLHSFIFGEIFDEAELPPGVFSIVPGGRDTGELLVTHPGVDKISFTGSTTAGKRIASLCGAQLKRVSLELGGKSASVVLEDADLDAMAPLIVAAGMMNNGEACINRTRILAPRSRYGEVVEAIRSVVQAQRMGDPFDPEIDYGPLIAERQRDRVESLIGGAVDEGGHVVLGGGRPADLPKGWWVEPTLMTNVNNTMKIAQEEIFGPVLTVIPFDGIDEAVSIANDTTYGLAGSVWTSDLDVGLGVARRIRAGQIGINGLSQDPLQPFGGFKESGIGRENGPEGLDEFVEVKGINPPEDWWAVHAK